LELLGFQFTTQSTSIIAIMLSLHSKLYPFFLLLCLTASLYGISKNEIVEIRTVRGTSLSGWLSPGEQVGLVRGYYNTHPVSRNDLVAVVLQGRETPLVKIVKGLPGDGFQIMTTANACLISVNGQILLNRQHQPYRFSGKRCQMLRLYEADYHQRIPSESYLLLGNLTDGTLDSTQFGLIGRGQLIGKIIPL
jgi:signal peptidase I